MASDTIFLRQSVLLSDIIDSADKTGPMRMQHFLIDIKCVICQLIKPVIAHSPWEMLSQVFIDSFLDFLHKSRVMIIISQNLEIFCYSYLTVNIFNVIFNLESMINCGWLFYRIITGRKNFIKP